MNQPALPTARVVIVGAGQAGRWVAVTLRAQGHTGRIVWLGEEAHAPYERPPLSKAVMLGDVALADLALLPEPRLQGLATDWMPNHRVTRIDAQRRAVHAQACGGAAAPFVIDYDVLFLAPGGRARTLPGLAPHPRVLTLRTHEDALALKLQVAQAQRVLVLGGGWIGLEVAASARKLGKAVTVLEAAPRLCARTVPPCVSDHLLALHLGHGVDVRLGHAVQAVQPDAEGVSVTLANGDALRGDVLVVGIGLVANDALAAEAGLATGNGVWTDAQGRTSDPAIFAVGDAANTLRGDDARVRLESWENAQRQAVTAAKAALGVPHDDAAEGPPWFWSDQFDDNLQVLGTPTEAMRLLVRDVPEKRQRLFFFCEGPRVMAVAAVNAGRDVKVVKRWWQRAQAPQTLEALADPTLDLNKLPVQHLQGLPAAQGIPQ